VAITLTLMLYEMATNAAKHGALSRPEGRVRVVWALREDAGRTVVDLCWEERDGPTVSLPCRTGFGSRLLQMGAQQIGGTLQSDYGPRGVVCRLSFPVVAPAGVTPAAS
jgi:two-component sensor histidine kinase